MRVLIAPDCFTGTLSASQAAEAIAAGWARSAPEDDLLLVPLSDGGPGLLEVLSNALGGVLVGVTVEDPMRRPARASILMVDGNDMRTAYIESAQACGLHLVAPGERNPSLTSTYGVGQLIEAAVAEGAGRVVVGLGGSGTNDGGAGMLAALGAGSPDSLALGGARLRDLSPDSLHGLTAVRERFKGVDLVLATDVDSPLLGLQGASAVFAQQKGATPEMAQELEFALGRFSEVVRMTLPAGTDLLSGKEMRLDRAPGAGAAGGLGYGLLLLGGRRQGGAEVVLEAVGFDARVQSTDLVVTGEGTFDWQSLHGNVVTGVASAALAQAKPTLVIAGQVLLGRRDAMALGVSGTYAVAETAAQLEAAIADPAGTLSARTRRVATTWSPRQR
ncbi:MAG: glycerate kinase [Dermatophilaceae bacterium]